MLHFATTIRRTKLMALKQDHRKTFHKFNTNVRAVAATCAYSVKCPHACCTGKALVGDIRKDVLGMAKFDEKSDKNIIKLI